ncbi:LytR/AlgR family response regulator transcription factor [Spirosoma panaciterrae]|uniref:LytR/AlgR family response regulator transcription factor n=1 Tax=Spirosoma panaciterrae TaxID=496058 RepID=UPI000A054254|nr:LytTR family DNA-binding domain-containing protein [Spirosoma panaciterrae]
MQNVFSSSKGKQVRIDPQRVLYMTGDANYCYLHLLDGSVLLMARTLKWYSQRWPHFLRVHKQVLVNPTYARKFTLAPSLRLPSYLIMSNQARVPISRRRLSLVRHQLNDLPYTVVRREELEVAELVG